jgi:hypothetical protein
MNVAIAPITSLRPKIEVAVPLYASPNQTLAIMLMALKPNGAEPAKMRLPTKIHQKLPFIAAHILQSAPRI